jgi:hypothetical protein
MSDESTKAETPKNEPATTQKEFSDSSTPKKSGGSKVWIIVLLVVLALCCLASLVGGGIWTIGYLGSQSNKSSVVNEPMENETTQPGDSNGSTSDSSNDSSGQGEDLLNDFFATGSDFEVRVDDVNRNGDDVEISLSVKNNSSDSQTFSTLIYLSLVSDTNSDGYMQDFLTPLYREEGAQLDAEIPAGETDRGVVVYKITDNPNSLTLRVSEGLFSGEYVSIPIM